MSSVGYESWFVSARDPEATCALWIRRTALDVGERAVDVAAWCTTFQGSQAHTVKQVWRKDDVPPELTASATRFAGTAAMGGTRATWELSVTPEDAEPLRPLRPRALYRLPVPRTKTEVPVPLGTLRGRLDVAGRSWQVHGWPATVGHNWGAEHAEQWAWLHGAHLGRMTWLELVLARVRVGGRLTPWLATGALAIGARRWFLGSPLRPALVHEVLPTVLDATVEVGAARVRVHADAVGRAATPVEYRDPTGSTRIVVHTGLAPTVVTVFSSRGESSSMHGVAAFEVGSVDGWPRIRPAALPLEGAPGC